MIISENQSLLEYNTFKIDVKSKFFTIINTVEELKILLKEPVFKENRFLILGEGSNILFTENFDGLIILNKIKGYSSPVINGNEVIIKINSGENWDNFVNYCVENNWSGVENLVSIPGTVGASPVQNIGAYGCEVKDVLLNVGAIDINTGEYRIFNNNECEFGYRNSIFKNKLKNKYYITDVTYKLNINHNFSIDYGDVKNELNKRNLDINLINIKTVIADIRAAKLPDPKVIGNAGSFFKNPFISIDEYEKIKQKHPDIKAFKNNGGYKLAAGWLIEQCGWKGKNIGNAAVHEKQALVIINKGNASGSEILKLSKAIQESVYEKFNVLIEPEVNIY